MLKSNLWKIVESLRASPGFAISLSTTCEIRMDAALSFSACVDAEEMIGALSNTVVPYRSGPRMTMFRWRSHMISVYPGADHSNCSVQIKADSIDAIIDTYNMVDKRVKLSHTYRADFMNLSFVNSKLSMNVWKMIKLRNLLTMAFDTCDALHGVSIVPIAVVHPDLYCCFCVL